jgi:hypothetical protein
MNSQKTGFPPPPSKREEKSGLFAKELTITGLIFIGPR